MRALILAAGRGSRLRPLTDVVPKPLVEVNGTMLCAWQRAALKRAGISEVVMNTAHLADAFEDLPKKLKPSGFDVKISREGDTDADALESLGGIVKALDLLAPNGSDEPFLVLAADVVHNFDLVRLLARADDIARGKIDAHIVGVPNPDFHAAGDMTILADGRIEPGCGPHTYACLMIAAPRIFRGLPVKRAKLFPWLWEFARAGRATGEVFTGFWDNVGSPVELQRLRENREALRWAQY